MAVAGFFAYYGFGFLALAELFVYVGGVLVLVLFAIMLVQRAGSGAPVLESRIDVLAVVASAATAVLLFAMVRPLAATFASGPVGEHDNGSGRRACSAGCCRSSRLSACCSWSRSWRSSSSWAVTANEPDR